MKVINDESLVFYAPLTGSTTSLENYGISYTRTYYGKTTYPRYHFEDCNNDVCGNRILEAFI
jgi:hypothetical protein